MNRISVSFMGLLCVLSGCTSHAPKPTEHTADARVSLGQTPRRFSIAASDARVALDAFSRQAHLQLLFDARELKGRTTQAVDGKMEPLYALNDILKDSGLRFAWVDEQTLSISPEPAHP